MEATEPKKFQSQRAKHSRPIPAFSAIKQSRSTTESHNDDALQELEARRQNGKQLTSKDYELAISACIRNGEVNEAMSIWRRMKSEGCGLDQGTFFNLLKGLRLQGGLKEVFEVWGPQDDESDEAKYSKMQRDRPTYHLMIEACLDEGDINKATKLWEEMKRTPNDQPLLPTYILLLDAFLKIKDLDRALRIMNELKQKSRINKRLTPTDRMYGRSISELANVQRLDDALGLMEDMVSAGCRPYSKLYRVLIQKCMASKRYEDAERLIASMKRARVIPDTLTYNTLLRFARYHQSLAVVFVLEKEMETHGIVKDTDTLFLLLDSHLLASHGDHKKRAAAIEEELKKTLLMSEEEKKEEEGVRHHQVFNEGQAATIIQRYAGKRETLPKALEWWELLCSVTKKENGRLPVARSWLMILSACCRAGDMEKAVELWHEHRRLAATRPEDVAIQPITATYNVLIEGYMTTRQQAKALALWTELKEGEGNLRPDSTGCLSIVRGCTRTVKEEWIEKGKEAFDYLKAMVKEGGGREGGDHQEKDRKNLLYAYQAMMEGLMKCRKPEEAFVLWKEMPELGLERNRETYMIMIQCCALLADPRGPELAKEMEMLSL